jgi:hypothetical protein
VKHEGARRKIAAKKRKRRKKSTPGHFHNSPGIIFASHPFHSIDKSVFLLYTYVMAEKKSSKGKPKSSPKGHFIASPSPTYVTSHISTPKKLQEKRISNPVRERSKSKPKIELNMFGIKEISDIEILSKISASLERIDENLTTAHKSIKKIDKKLGEIDHNVTHAGIP